MQWALTSSKASSSLEDFIWEIYIQPPTCERQPSPFYRAIKPQRQSFSIFRQEHKGRPCKRGEAPRNMGVQSCERSCRSDWSGVDSSTDRGDPRFASDENQLNESTKQPARIRQGGRGARTRAAKTVDFSIFSLLTVLPTWWPRR